MLLNKAELAHGASGGQPSWLQLNAGRMFTDC